MRGFVRQSIHWSVGPSIRPTTRQPDKKQSQEIPKPRTYDFFPTARVSFIGIAYLGFKNYLSMVFPGILTQIYSINA